MPELTPPGAAVRCPCLSGFPYSECCQPFHLDTAVVPTAEQLMRSRYSAFALADVSYLLNSWHPHTRPVALTLDADQRWYRLDILATTRGTLRDTEGTVEFRAYSRHVGGTANVQHEVSRFVREQGRWVYLDGN